MLKEIKTGSLICAFVLLCGGAMAQDEGTRPAVTREYDANSVHDAPLGSPYNTGIATGSVAADSSRVPLRDYLSSRIDQIRAELIDRIEIIEKQQRQIIDERDRQYAQRFEAQQQALNAALQAAKEAVANALQASKEAVLKAEDAANKRFDSVNEFRQTLTDQANTFMSKAEAGARLKAVEDDIARIASRSEGATTLWVIIGGVVILILALANFAINYSNRVVRTPRA